MIKIYDNYLDSIEFNKLKETLMTNNFPYFFNNGVTYENDYFYFSHSLVTEEGKVNSDWTNYIVSLLLKNISYKKILKSKVNLYTQTSEIIKHGYHIDLPENKNNKVVLYYLNSNNGYTEFETGEIISSKENRLLIFDDKYAHRSTTCTDESCRISININYEE